MEHNVAREWSGSVCAGISTSQWPFGKLSVGPETIELRGLNGQFTILRENVQSVERGGLFPWLWMGIRIRHACAGYPQRLMFIPILFWRRAKILKYAKSLGYNVP